MTATGRRAWTVPSQVDRVALVTGATGGLGFETAKALAAAGARVIVTGRNPIKGEAALSAIRQAHPAAKVTFEAFDLASLDSVRTFAAQCVAAESRLDLLVNNAGVMAVPMRRETVDGFELQFGTNYLGHFALTGLLLRLLQAGQTPRIVDVASLAHRRGSIDFADPQGRRYAAWKAYSQSKLAMLIFAIEWQRRNAALNWGVRAFAAHPGWANTDIFANGPAMGGALGLKERLGVLAFPILGQSAAAGALPILYAATAADTQAGDYYGPDGVYELRGAPARANIAPHARDEETGAKLWALSVSLTGVDPAAHARTASPRAAAQDA